MAVMSYLNERARLLRETKRLLKKGWTQKVFARDASGDPESQHSKAAVCWCLTGALSRASEYKNISYENYVSVRQLLEEFIHAETDTWWTMTTWNDQKGRTQQEVIDLVDKAYREIKRQQMELEATRDLKKAPV
jgi:hypothetical protein